MIEPIFSGGGIIVPPSGYFKRLSKIVHDYNALLVVDEAHTGFGRTGKWFGVEHYDIAPDILTTCKGMGGGIPVSGVITTASVDKECADKGMHHGSTHQYNPIPAAAVGAVISAIESEGLVDAAKSKGEYFMKRLEELRESLPVIGDVRGKGLMIGVELVKPKTKDRQPAIELSKAVRTSCFRRGLLLGWLSTMRPAVFRIEPPLVIKLDEIDKAVEIFEASLKKALRTTPRSSFV